MQGITDELGDLDLNFTAADYWKAIILYGLNAATYKIALGKTLINLATSNSSSVSWDELAETFFNQYSQRLDSDPMPQQGNPSRRTVMERIVQEVQLGKIDRGLAIERVGDEAFGDVIKRFHNLGRIDDLQGKFYSFDFGKSLSLTDNLFEITESQSAELNRELDARWSLLEGAFTISNTDYVLRNELRSIYIQNGYDRKNLALTIPFLEGYQGNTCFYCGEPIQEGDLQVDHLLPRQVLMHDEIWNLVLSHSLCNSLKTDQVVGEHFVRKLIARNENIMGSNHPWKQKIADELGKTPKARAKAVKEHYDRVCTILGRHFWGGGEGFDPSTDPFYQRLITQLNNKS